MPKVDSTGRPTCFALMRFTRFEHPTRISWRLRIASQCGRPFRSERLFPQANDHSHVHRHSQTWVMGIEPATFSLGTAQRLNVCLTGFLLLRPELLGRKGVPTA